MKSGIALSLIVIAFVVGSFFPYFYLNDRIDEVYLKMDTLIENVKTNNQKIDDLHSIAGLEKDAHIHQEIVNDVSDQKLNEKVIVEIKNSIDM